MARASSVLVDFRLLKVPSEEDIACKIVRPLESLVGATFTRIPTTSKSSHAFEISGEKSAFLLVRVYDERQRASPDTKLNVLVTVNLELPGDADDALSFLPNMDLEDSLKTKLAKAFDDGQANFFPTLKRCLLVNPYLRSSDDRILEYNYQDVVFCKQSDFQHVLIVETPDFGRLLCLDYMANLAESDTAAYTHSVMNLPNENYDGKEVLILGGGDGALLKELLALPNPPSFVTMVDIDDVVMDACTEFMPSVAGNYMARGNRDGPNYKVFAGCAIQFLRNALASDKKYDYIFGDLTDTPVSTSPRDNDIWDFLKSIISMGVNLLKANTGRYLTHCNGKNVPEASAAYEKMLSALADGKCRFTRSECFVPSFMETWLYYQIWREA